MRGTSLKRSRHRLSNVHSAITCKAGIDSVTPLNSDLGSCDNDVGDAGESNLSVDVFIDAEDTISPTDDYAAQVCANGSGTFDAQKVACGLAYDCF